MNTTLSIRQNPPRFAVIGHPVAHSRSPAIHRLFAQQTGIALHYDLLPGPLDGFAATVAQFFAHGGGGLNVTLPFKEQAYALCRPTARAQRAGAVNTLWQEEEGEEGEEKKTEGKKTILCGCNTDGVGLLMDLVRLQVELQGARIVLIGAGGAARGVIEPLLHARCERLHIVNRNAQRAQALCRHFAGAGQSAGEPSAGGLSTDGLSAGGLDTAAGQWDVVINATSSGLQGDIPALPGLRYARHALAYDMLYASGPTPFLQAVQRMTHPHGTPRCADGLGMLVGQAAASFAIWHGVMPDMVPVLDTLRQEMSARG